MSWTATDAAWPLPEIKVLAWWPNWGGMMHVVHFDQKSWVSGSNAKFGRKVAAPTHWQFLPKPPPPKEKK